MFDIRESIWEAKYKQPNENTINDTFRRVANYVANSKKEADIFYQYMKLNKFLPGGRVLANAGTKIKNLSNCFVLDVQDSRQSIFQAMKDAADVYAWGGGIGYNFSELREEGAPISIGGTSSGPISFMKLFNEVADVIKIRSRRGATMGQMDISHPDIEKFILLKSSFDKNDEELIILLAESGVKSEIIERVEKWLLSKKFTHFNISVRLTNDFMNKVEKDEEFNLISPLDGKIVKTVKARELFNLLSKSAWATGDPGVVFVDRIAQDELMNDVWGPPKASNPCSELYLYPYESCNLGSINLVEHIDLKAKDIDWESLFNTAITLTMFLDNVVDRDVNIVQKINETRSYLRRIGLGVMGWADILLLLDIPYGSEKSIELSKKLSWFITSVSVMTSNLLAKIKAPAPFWRENRGRLNSHFIWKLWSEYSRYGKETKLFNLIQDTEFEFPLPEHGLVKYPLRNVSWTSIAPTGSLAILAGVSHSIEPHYKLVYKRNLELGEDKVQKVAFIKVDIVEKKLRSWGLRDSEIEEFYKQYTERGIKGVTVLPEDRLKILVDAHSLSPEQHVDVQAGWQEFVSNSISKTVNLPNNSTVEDVENIFIYMWEKGVKSSTIYRDGSKAYQVLN